MIQKTLLVVTLSSGPDATQADPGSRGLPPLRWQDRYCPCAYFRVHSDTIRAILDCQGTPRGSIEESARKYGCDRGCSGGIDIVDFGELVERD
jgi:hypothetical protein